MHKTPKGIARSLRAFRNAHRLGLARGVRILPGRESCQEVLKQFGSEYPADDVPHLPLAECSLAECQCRYLPVGTEKFRRLRATEASLPEPLN